LINPEITVSAKIALQIEHQVLRIPRPIPPEKKIRLHRLPVTVIGRIEESIEAESMG
jgi:hypothetical protein